MYIPTLEDLKAALQHIAERCWLLGDNPVWVKIEDDGERMNRLAHEIMVVMNFKTEHDGDYGMAIAFSVLELRRSIPYIPYM